MERITKTFPVFDCDAHIKDPISTWLPYVPESKMDLVRDTLWVDDDGESYLNGEKATHTLILNGSPQEVERQRLAGAYPVNTIKGPQFDNRMIHKIVTSMMPLDSAQWEYLDHKGAYDAHARVADLDLMGIDQVLVVPTVFIRNLMAVENDEGAQVVCAAYNDWLRDWCDEVPGRLYGAALLPQFSAEHAAAEVFRVADIGHPVALIRPVDARGRYPTPGPGALAQAVAAPSRSMDAMFRAFEETGVCLGMHTFPGQARARTEAPHFVSPNEYLLAGSSPTLGFIYEAQVWLAQVLLSGFLDRYPRLKMLIFESNSQWLPYVLAQCDRLFTLYRNERKIEAKRLPSEAFREQCMIGFESDEEPTQRQWADFEDIAIWSSDVYHHDAADAWYGIRSMRAIGVPEDVQAKLMGGNACRFYNIEPKLFVSEEPAPIDRPDWFPAGPELDEWAQLAAHPRKNADALRERGWGAKTPAAVGDRRY